MKVRQLLLYFGLAISLSGVALGVQPFSDPELDAAPSLEVVSVLLSELDSDSVVVASGATSSVPSVGGTGA